MLEFSIVVATATTIITTIAPPPLISALVSMTKLTRGNGGNQAVPKEMFTPSPAFQEIASAWNVKKDLKKLEAMLSIKFVLLDAEEQQEKNNKVKDWLGKLKHVFCDVEDVIDDFATEAVRRN
ncbi:hypothetical protein ACSBR1_017846 [Camellia fascicularis]